MLLTSLLYNFGDGTGLFAHYERVWLLCHDIPSMFDFIPLVVSYTTHETKHIEIINHYIDIMSQDNNQLLFLLMVAPYLDSKNIALNVY